VIWTAPSLAVSTGDLPVPVSSKRPEDSCGERTAMMPERRRTRRQHSSASIRAERARNQRARSERRRRWVEYHFPEPVPPRPGDEPPPF